jgi:hypothetical protein
VERAAADRERRARFREQLGLPTEGIVVMAGHQAEFWHPGILAKWFAMHAVVRQLRARGLAAHAAWLVVDQDANDPRRLAFPARVGDAPGSELWTLGQGIPEVPTGSSPPIAPGAPPEAAASSPCARELARIAELLRSRAGEPDLASQFTGALTDDLSAWTGPASIVRATALSRTTLMINLIRWLDADAPAAVLAYNAAAITEPGADVRPLQVDERAGKIELPLWRVQQGVPRARVHAGEVSQIPADQLAPRAILMTALVRLAACDLFIHGLGGERYEHVTDRWLASWLPVERPAPVAVASATRFMPGLAGASPPPTPEEIRDAVWRAEHARNDPAMVGDQTGAAQKAALLRELREARTKGPKREAFLKMRRALEEAAARNAAALEVLDARAARLRQRAAESAVVYRRDWPAALYPKDAIARLRRDIDGAFGLSPERA